MKNPDVSGGPRVTLPQFVPSESKSQETRAPTDSGALDSCTIPVTGMHCAGCSSRIQRQLEETTGVTSANVNLMTGAATVEFDRTAVTPERLVEVIRDTGYGAELPAQDKSFEQTLETEEAARRAEILTLQKKFGVSLIVAVLVMLISMPLAEQVPGAMRD